MMRVGLVAWRGGGRVSAELTDRERRESLLRGRARLCGDGSGRVWILDLYGKRGFYIDLVED